MLPYYISRKIIVRKRTLQTFFFIRVVQTFYLYFLLESMQNHESVTFYTFSRQADAFILDTDWTAVFHH